MSRRTDVDYFEKQLVFWEYHSFDLSESGKTFELIANAIVVVQFHLNILTIILVITLIQLLVAYLLFFCYIFL